MGKYILRNKRKQPPPTSGRLVGSGFKLTPSGNYDMTNKKLENLKPPENKTDGVNLEYVTENCLLKSKLGPYDARNVRITNLNNPQENSDVVNLKYFNDNSITYPSNKNYISLKGKYRFTDAGDIPAHEKRTLIHVDYLRNNAITLGPNNNYQGNSKIIENVGDARVDTDCVNKRTVLKLINDLSLKPGITLGANNNYQGNSKIIENVADARDDMDVVNKRSVMKLISDHTLSLRGTSKFQANARVIENLSNPIKGTDAANKQSVIKLINEMAVTGIDKVLFRSEDTVGTPNLPVNNQLTEVAVIGEKFTEILASLVVLTKDILFLKVQVNFEIKPGISVIKDTFNLEVFKVMGLRSPSERVYSNQVKIGTTHQYDTIYIPNLKKGYKIGMTCTSHTGIRQLPYKMFAVFERVF